jgi:hypothetical protein
MIMKSLGDKSREECLAQFEGRSSLEPSSKPAAGGWVGVRREVIAAIRLRIATHPWY